ncbi:MAG: Cytochrome b6-f complex iron-sulfur subunit [Chloroflexi bacterium]|nr:Cytochrome b6-f complex iron-sulfur subunit [Chloroflexota bacterium]
MTSITRRDFLKIIKQILAATGLTALFSPVVAFFYPPSLEETPADPVLVGAVDDIPQGEALTVAFGRYPALVINTEQGLRAYSAVCTHFACLVDWDAGLEQIVCPCHEGYFEPLEGGVISGPPPSPLESIPLEIVDGEIYIGGAS